MGRVYFEKDEMCEGRTYEKVFSELGGMPAINREGEVER